MPRPRSEMDDLMEALGELTKASQLLHGLDARKGSRTRRQLVLAARKDADAATSRTRQLVNAQVEALRPVG